MQVIPSCLSKMKSLRVVDFSSVSSMENTLSDILCDWVFLETLETLWLEESFIIGSIPDCMNSMKSLQKLYLMHNEINGSIPHYVCLLHKLEEFRLWNNTQITGTVPDCIGSMKSLQWIDFSTLSLSGSIPSNICNLTLKNTLSLDNNHFNGTIDECFGTFSIHTLFNIDLSFNPLTGTIPQTFCNRTTLQELMIDNTGLHGTYPNCINKFSNLTKISIANTLITGSIESLPPNLQRFFAYHTKLHGNFPVLPTSAKQIIIHQNAFTGSLSTIFQNVSFMTDLTDVTFNDNDFHEDNIHILLSEFFMLPELKLLSIANNKNIKGTIPEYQTLQTQETLQYFLAHNLSLTGALPNKLTFSNIIYLTLYNNRMSCGIPDNLISNNNLSHSNYTAMILSSNLFSCSTESDFPDWIKYSQISLKNAHSVYITKYDQMKCWVLGICSGFCFVIILFLKRKDRYLKTALLKNVNEPTEYEIALISDDNINQDESYICQMEQLNAISKSLMQLKHKFSDYYIIYIIAILLSCIYFVKSEYFDCTRFCDRFSISFYVDDIEWINWIVISLWIALNSFYLYIITSLIKQEFIHPSQTYLDKSRSTSIQFSNESDNTVTINTLSPLTMFRAFFYLFLYFSCVGLTILYVICESLPTENELNLNETKIIIVTQSMAFVLTFSNSFVVPKMVDNVHRLIHRSNDLSKMFITQRRTIVIFLVRTLSTIIIPIISSIVLLNDCGHGWVKFWSQCYGDSKSKFNVFVPVNIFGFIQDPHLELIKSSEICGFQSIDWSNCLRRFFYSWTRVIILKMLLMVFMPFVVTISKILWKRFLKLLYTRCGGNNYLHTYVGKKLHEYIYYPKIHIDVEYAMICTKIESMIIFSFVTPMVIPITLLSIYTNLFVYHFTVKSKKADIYPFEASSVMIPIHMTLSGIIIAQIFSILFATFLINSIAPMVTLVVSLFFVDIYFGAAIIKRKTSKHM